MTRQQNFFGRIVAASDVAALMASYLIAYTIRRKMWELAYPVLPIGSARASAWIITVMFPAWLLALRYFHLYNPITYRSTWRVIGASFKAQILASVLMLNAVFIIRGFNGVSRPLLALISHSQPRHSDGGKTGHPFSDAIPLATTAALRGLESSAGGQPR